jgi:adenine-specific DNA-methyltransferase
MALRNVTTTPQREKAQQKRHTLPTRPDEKPSDYANRLGQVYASKVTEDHKKNLGQFFTPVSVARFMAQFVEAKTGKIKILDPGCGLGILSICVIEEIISANKIIHSIELVAFESDLNILPLVEKSFKYLTEWLQKRKVSFTYFLCKNDFILHNSRILTNQQSADEVYDIVISNPPYFKLPKDDERAIAAKSVIYGQTNIYSIFLLIATKLLSENGQLIVITPRSFCSGNYFRLFRELFFSSIYLKSIHLFNSRKDAFRKDKVLLENVIVVASPKRPSQLNQVQLPFAQNTDTIVTISSSEGIDDLQVRRVKDYKTTELVNLNSWQKILHLPASDIDEKVISIFRSWEGSLSSYGFEISTGPVVDFRSEAFITSSKKKNSVPLIWLGNVEAMNVIWPIKGLKGKPKGQYITNQTESLSRLVPNKNYVLLRRFSAKDDSRRLIAAPHFKTQYSVTMMGIENHLNYIYHLEDELSESQIIGLATLLNSRLFDLYFRTFNGNINVSATELRDFPLPELSLIEYLGKKVGHSAHRIFTKDIDDLVASIFELEIDLSKAYGQ